MEQLEMRMTTDLATAMPAEIGFNFDEMKSALAAKLEHYNHLVVTEDTIQEGKADLANLRKLRDALETRRKDVKREWNQPITIFEAKVKELTALIDEPVRIIDSQIKGFAEQQRQQKLTEIEAIYAEVVPDNLKEIIPLQKILDPTWLNKTTSLKKVREAIDNLAKRTNVDMVLIDGVNPKFMAAVRKKYIDTLDITTALNYQDELLAAEEQFRQQEEARQQREAQRAAWASQAPKAEEKPPVTAQEPVREPAPIPRQDTKLYDLKLAFRLTQCQATALKQFLVENNIQYQKII